MVSVVTVGNGIGPWFILSAFLSVCLSVRLREMGVADVVPCVLVFIVMVEEKKGLMEGYALRCVSIPV